MLKKHLDLEKKEPIYLLGKVKTPGQYDLAEGNMTVYQMIAYAGGFDEWADTENIMIILVSQVKTRWICPFIKYVILDNSMITFS